MSQADDTKIPVLVCGALGKMGQEVVRTITSSTDMELVAAIDTSAEFQGNDIGLVIGLDALDIPITSDLEGSLCVTSQKYRNSSKLKSPVLIDFTHPSVVYEHTRAAIAYGVHPVIGTTGLEPSQIKELIEFSYKASIGGAIIPNFSVGVILLQKAAAMAAKFYDHVELIESHHNFKADAPSGTCIKTAELIEESKSSFNNRLVDETESIKGSRGGLRSSGLRLHSVRLPGIVANQEVVFGASGETYTLSHNTIDRSAYMPGVKLAVKEVRELPGLIYGLEQLL